MMRCLGVGSLAIVSLFPGSANACDRPAPEFLEIDRSITDDTQPPDAPVLGEVRIGRSYGPRDEGCSRASSSSCDGYGALGIQIEPGQDDRPGPIGYLVRLVDGRLPGGFTPYDQPVLLLSGGLYVSFPDPGPSDQEPIDVTFEVIAVDRAGNESAPTVGRATSPGDEGCSFAGLGRSGLFASGVVVLALGALCGRRFRRRDA